MSIAFRWSKNVGKNVGKNTDRRALNQQRERASDMDAVTLVDGSVMLTPRASLVAAKDLLAAQKAAERRVAERQRAMRWLIVADVDADEQEVALPTGLR